MNRIGRGWVRRGVFASAVCFLAVGLAAQVSPDLYSGLRWRSIGPFHGGRVAAISGAIGQPGTFYAGLPQGGIWKTTSGGMTWYPVFDDVTQVDSIGAIAVAPSDANIVYAGSGDAVEHAAGEGEGGDGMYKSTDGGKTWAHIGLEGTYKIPRILVDPKNPNIVVVAALSGLHGTQRGIFRSEDGGQTWTNVLAPDAVTGGRDLASAYDAPNVIFATTIADGVDSPPPGRGGGRGANTPNHTHLYKSTDEGKTWSEVANSPEANGRTAAAVAMHTQGRRVFVIGGSGLYRSDDQGATWKRMAAGDSRVTGNSYICGVWVDSQNPDVVYTMNTAAYRSTDGGATFEAFKGAPGGEDMHEVWIDPADGQRMAYGNDQGAAVTFDGGKTWSGYYAVPVAQIYHVSTDNRYPYWVMGSQQDTGAVMVRSRGDVGDISEVDWLPVPSSEFGTVTADPLNPNIIYGVGYGAAGGGSGLVKINLRTGQWENASPNYGADASKYRASRESWRRPDPFDPHTMYMDMQCVMASHDQGHSWKAISPDLTTPAGAPPVVCGARTGAAPAAGGGRGAAAPVLNDFAVSTLRKGVFWTISSNGQIYNSFDGGLHWSNVSHLPDTRVTLTNIEAGHTDADTAYISGQALGADNNAPLIWRTHDGGKTWTKIINGLPSGQPSGSWVNVVREDPHQKGLLYCGTETTAYVSFDDGGHWQSLRQNLPTTSVKDMVFHTADHMNDLVIATYGRGFWVMDDVSPLREIAAKGGRIAAAPAYLFKPGDAIRARVSDNWDQPMNPELPHSANPPYGAIFYYHLSQTPSAPLTLKVYDAAGKLVRTLSSVPPKLPATWPYPSYWVGTPAELALSTAAGTDRFNWDLRYDDPPAYNLDVENQMNVEPGGFVTPGPHGPQVIPGVYTLKLTVDGQTYTQTVTVRNDPRVGEGAAVMAALRAKNSLVMRAYQAAKDSYQGNQDVVAVRAQVAGRNSSGLPAALASQATALEARLNKLGSANAGRGGRGGGGFGGRGAAPAPGALLPFNALNGEFDGIISTQQVGIDEAPTQAMVDTWEADCKSYNATLAAWKTLQSGDLAAFNQALSQVGQQPIAAAAGPLSTLSCSVSAAPAPANKH